MMKKRIGVKQRKAAGGGEQKSLNKAMLSKRHLQRRQASGRKRVAKRMMLMKNRGEGAPAKAGPAKPKPKPAARKAVRKPAATEEK